MWCATVMAARPTGSGLQVQQYSGDARTLCLGRRKRMRKHSLRRKQTVTNGLTRDIFLRLAFPALRPRSFPTGQNRINRESAYISCVILIENC